MFNKKEYYIQLISQLDTRISAENDEVAILAISANALHNGINYVDWAGFYRTTASDMLTIGPFIGNYGVTHIPYNKGACGRAASEQATVIIENTNQLIDPDRFSYAAVSEIAIPLFNRKNKVFAVLNAISKNPTAIDNIDKYYLEHVCHCIANNFTD